VLPVDPDALLEHADLLEVLERARRLGFTGAAPPEEHVAHALRFLGALDAVGADPGVPGLVLALALPRSTWVLVEAMERRAGPLVDAVNRLDLAGRVTVWRGRAEEFARSAGQRGSADLVTARGFASPGATAECAAPLLRLGGFLAVSEPPESDGSRWPPAGLAEFGLAPVGVREGVMLCTAVETCPDTFPRRVGIPSKRPVF
jgi:16S rRNA (guanine527-N7)-methyltransferase